MIIRVEIRSLIVFGRARKGKEGARSLSALLLNNGEISIA